ncbi:hypothetical protein LEL_07440 [Akanthomyces lecanii RCEF 1005]|uniref:Altered inheritance of mitochondria protein 11 n=1 Tax=Akanthomyces lecanii RCEF 1005 TaxID=1081108 RepID=A0A162JYU9_CORDF|nr:hypothetical protein LEL_07440 [Akanthomyces lecanii RCEF 1005]
MGFLAKLLAPHVVGTPEPGSSSPSPPSPDSSSTTTSSSSPPRAAAPAPNPSQQRHRLPPAAPSPVIDTSRTAHLTPLQRQTSQLSLLLLGGSFMAATVFVTRRAVLRRQRESIPRFFHASYLPPGHPHVALDGGERSTLAAQALGLATLNVAGFAVLLTGGTAWAFDLCSVAELQARTQMRRDAAGGGHMGEDEEREVDNMVMGLMERLGMDVEGLKEQDRLAAEKADETASKA